MTREEVLTSLCYYDKRNPDSYWPPEDMDGAPEPRKGCSCDNCFYGRDKLAVYILELTKEGTPC
jgi:hypothetical protein